MKSSILFFAGSLLLITITTANAAETIRCGSALIEDGDSIEKVLEHCGEPTSKEGATWIYDRGSGQFVAVIHVGADGTVNRVEERDRL